MEKELEKCAENISEVEGVTVQKKENKLELTLDDGVYKVPQEVYSITPDTYGVTPASNSLAPKLFFIE